MEKAPIWLVGNLGFRMPAKKEASLGVKSLILKNKVLVNWWLWKFPQEIGSIWNQVI